MKLKRSYERPGRMVTIKDISNELGISVSAVSRALNPNSPQRNLVSADNIRLICETAERMGYRRNRHAEFMQRGRSATIGVFIPEFANRLIADLMFGISECAALNGFPVSFFPGMGADSYVKFIEANVSNPGSGIISYPFLIEECAKVRSALERYAEGGGKVLLLNSPPETMPTLSMDEFYGGRLAAQALLRHDCDCYMVRDFEHGRRSGFEAELESAGALPRLRHFTDDTLEEELERAAEGHRSCGVFGMTDLEALHCLNVFQRLGREVGRDAFVVGYDDLDFSEACDPPLTTIHQPFREFGRAAVEKLLKIIYGDAENHETIKPWRIDRHSA